MHDIVPHCVQDQLGYCVESKFSHYVISMSFCGLHRYPQDCCHVLRSTALPDHLHDLSLPWRQSRLQSSVLIVPPRTQVPPSETRSATREVKNVLLQRKASTAAIRSLGPSDFNTQPLTPIAKH